MPNQYSINSTNQFIDLLYSQNGQGIMASLDVESLFTNVPIVDTIDIISDYVYRNCDKLPPQIPETILRAMLELCTSKSPFISPTGQIYHQIDGVAMDSPLGPTFANYYMGHLENRIFNNLDIKPKIYVRYMDDIFLCQGMDMTFIYLVLIIHIIVVHIYEIIFFIMSINIILLL